MNLHPSRHHRHHIAVGLCLAAGVVCAAMRPASAGTPEPEPISWRSDYAGALEESKASNRLLWIQFTGPWCPNCKRMERDSFPDPEIIQHARESYVPLRLRSDVHEELALGFNLSGLPATIIVAPNREVVAVRQGYLGPDELDSLLSDVRTAWQGRESGKKTAVARSGQGRDRRAGPRTPGSRASPGSRSRDIAR